VFALLLQNVAIVGVIAAIVVGLAWSTGSKMRATARDRDDVARLFRDPFEREDEEL